MAFVTASMAGLYLYRLGSLAPRLSPTEFETVTLNHQLVYILHNPLDIIYKLLVWGSLHVPKLPGLWQARLPSVLLGLISIGLAAYILHHWYGRRSAVYGFFIFASSAWILHAARFASADIIAVLAILAVLATHINLHDHEKSAAAWFVWLLTMSLLLFTPGMLWLVILAAFWQGRAVLNAWSNLSIWQRTLSVVAPLSVLGTLAQGFITGYWLPSLLAWLGIPRQLPLVTLTQLPHNVLTTLLSIVWRAPVMPETWLGNVPILNAFLIAAFVAGLIFYVRHWQATRAQMLGSYLILGVGIASLGNVSIGILVPILYLIAVAGIAYALQFWLHVFPRNPLARGFGIGLITILVGMSCYFGLAQYFIAWPHNPDTLRVYQTQR